MKFIFDLDGTLTSLETLPYIANHFGVGDQIDQLTKKTIYGDVPFIESFIKRIDILGKFSAHEINALLANIPLFSKLLQFIHENKDDCYVATGNLDVWVSGLLDKIGCHYFTSAASLTEDRVSKLNKIIKKEDVVKKLKESGEPIVFIGDGNNDAEAMRCADVSIACGLVHYPAKSILAIADYLIFDEDALLRLLEQIKNNQKGKSVVISCAGIGSRLGMGHTKSLININGKFLIEHQIERFENIEDIRIVVGFQATELVDVVLKKRKDIIFIFNHDYFHTKTGASFYLGARHANEYVIAWDGDLIVHPDDVSKCLDYEGEYIACSDIKTEDAVFVQLDDNKNVISFSRERGDYEWSGPACLKKEKIKYVSGNVYSQLESCLPINSLYIRAQDIDTYEDYKNAIEFINSWNTGNINIDAYYTKLAEKITSPVETRNKAKDFSTYDVNFVKNYACSESSLLDLGAGTGLLINNLTANFKEIVAVEKYKNFSDFIEKLDNVTVINEDILNFNIDKKFDLVTIFGVMNFFNYHEASKIYSKAYRFIKTDGKLIVKHQMGINEDVIVNGHSEELNTYYFSHYRQIDKEVELLKQTGFSRVEIIDIYPSEFNRWENTHFYALVCEK